MFLTVCLTSFMAVTRFERTSCLTFSPSPGLSFLHPFFNPNHKLSTSWLVSFFRPTTPSLCFSVFLSVSQTKKTNRKVVLCLPFNSDFRSFESLPVICLSYSSSWFSCLSRLQLMRMNILFLLCLSSIGSLGSDTSAVWMLRSRQSLWLQLKQMVKLKAWGRILISTRPFFLLSPNSSLQFKCSSINHSLK